MSQTGRTLTPPPAAPRDESAQEWPKRVWISRIALGISTDDEPLKAYRIKPHKDLNDFTEEYISKAESDAMIAKAKAEARLEGAYIESQLQAAKRHLNAGDAHMANYCLRDLKICEEMGRTDLLWAYHNGNPCEREIKDEIELIVAHLKAQALEGGRDG